METPNFRNIRLIGLVGFKGVGKDTGANELINIRNEFKRMAFATRLKNACSEMFGWRRDLLEGDTAVSRKWREAVDPFWSEVIGDSQFTPRKALQKLGTESVRDVFSPDVWCAALKRDIVSVFTFSNERRIVVTDVRFPNEVDMIRKMDGIVVRIKRGDDPTWFEMLRAGKTPKEIETELGIELPHQSEWAWYRCKIDHVIENDATPRKLGERLAALI